MLCFLNAIQYAIAANEIPVWYYKAPNIYCSKLHRFPVSMLHQLSSLWILFKWNQPSIYKPSKILYNDSSYQVCTTKNKRFSPLFSSKQFKTHIVEKRSKTNENEDKKH